MEIFYDAITLERGKTMTTVILLGYVAVIIISYKGAVMALDKSGLL